MASRQGLPAEVKRSVDSILRRYCRERIPLRLRGKVKIEYEIKGGAVTLVECRPRYEDPEGQWTRTPFGQIRFDGSKKLWRLFCADRNERWHRYKSQEPNTSLEALLMAIELDDSGIFFG